MTAVGNSMKGISGKSKTGVVYRYYTCKPVAELKRCKQKNINKDYIEDIVIKNCKQLLNDENIALIAKEVYETCQRENNKNLAIKEYESLIKTTEKAIENLLDAIEKGANVDIINQRITEKREELERAKTLLIKEKSKIINIDEQHIKFFLNQLKNGDIDDILYRKKLLKIFVNQIHLREKELIIIFNVSKQKITLSVPITDNVIKSNTILYNHIMVSQEGFEPPTPGLEGLCSIQLSY